MLDKERKDWGIKNKKGVSHLFCINKCFYGAHVYKINWHLATEREKCHINLNRKSNLQLFFPNFLICTCYLYTAFWQGAPTTHIALLFLPTVFFPFLYFPWHSKRSFSPSLPSLPLKLHTVSFSGQLSGLHCSKTGLFYWITNTVYWCVA